MSWIVHCGDSLHVLRGMAEASVDAIVTDPPYGLAFMGKRWDYDVPSVEIWAECLRVLKPGGHLLAFAGTRTQHRMAVRIEDAGFEIRDMIAWVYGSGFPKSLDVSKAIDRMDASEEQERRRLRFTAWVRSTGVTSRQIDEATQTNMGGHYTTAASQPAIMTREHLEQCRHLLGDVPEWVKREADIRSVESQNMASRQVIGSFRSSLGGTVAAGERDADFIATHKERIVFLTAPATDAARQWQGWGTALKPSLEPVTVARKPIDGTVASNVLKWGTGGLNVNGCRVGAEDGRPLTISHGEGFAAGQHVTAYGDGLSGSRNGGTTTLGRWPANLIHDGSEEVARLFPQAGDESAARFFYSAKADTAEREVGCERLAKATAAELVDRKAGSAGMDNPRAGAGRTSSGRGNTHPTVKPVDLMRYLVRLVTPRGGLVLDPFAGSGTTGIAALLEGCSFTGIELDPRHVEIANARIAAAECRDIYAGSDGSTKLREKGDERQTSLFDFSSPTVGEPAGSSIAVATAATGSAYDSDDLPW